LVSKVDITKPCCFSEFLELWVFRGFWEDCFYSPQGRSSSKSKGVSDFKDFWVVRLDRREMEYSGVDEAIVVLDGCFPNTRVPLVGKFYSLCDNKGVLPFATDKAKFLERELDLVVVEVESL
jgi:hypothetical protein